MPREYCVSPQPYEVQWLGPFRGWKVCFMHVRKTSGGRETARFKGKFAKVRAQHRAAWLSKKWIREHNPLTQGTW